MKYLRKMNESKFDDTMSLHKHTGRSMEDCSIALEEAGGDLSKAVSILKKKAPKEKKVFQVGDIVVRMQSADMGKLRPDVADFLRTYRYFKILEINDKKNIDIGYIGPEGRFWFSPNKFELRDKPKVDDVKKEINDIEKIENELKKVVSSKPSSHYDPEDDTWD